MAEPAAEPGQAGLPSREQAEEQYDEAVAEAVQACAEDTAGQRCYICFGEGDEDEGLVRGCSCRGASGFAHVSCLARGAQAAVERDADTGWTRWHTCGLCEQEYHGVVFCALGWACWKTYVGRPETDDARAWAMTALGIGLSAVGNHEDALSVRLAVLSMMKRLDEPEEELLVAQNNLASSYDELGRLEEALSLRQEVYSGRVKLDGEENERTLCAANNYASSLTGLERFEEARSLLRKTTPAARRALGEGHRLTLKMRWNYAQTLYIDDGATLDDLCEAVTTLEESARIVRRVFGGANPLTAGIEDALQDARATLRAREAPDGLVGDDDARLVLVQDAHDLSDDVLEVLRALGLTASTPFSQRLADAEDTGQTDDETVDVSAQEDDADDAARLAALEASITPPPPPTTPPPKVGCAPGCFGRSS